MAKHINLQATSPLAMWLDYISHIHSSTVDLGLERVGVIAEKAKLTKPAPHIITVAGTNGKGSTCAFIDAILRDAGYSVGVYSSPHLIRFTERVRINGKEVSDDKFTEAFDFIDHQRGDVSLSFFEFTTLAALQLFKTAHVDVVVLEVGLGGRLDATNVVDHDVSVITSLAIDHVDWLGNDINKIAYEKAGIFRSQRAAICGQPNPPATVAAHADDISAELYQVGIQFSYIENEDDWDWLCGAYDLRQLPKPSLPLPNAATALMALGCVNLDISDINIVNGLKSASLPGRMQKIHDAPVVILDVAHNPHSAAYFSREIKARYPGKTVHAVVGMLHDKDIKETLHMLSDMVSYWYPASLHGPRAATSAQLTQYLPDGIQEYENPVVAFKAAMTQADANDVIVVVGSFHTVGEVLEFWQMQGEP